VITVKIARAWCDEHMIDCFFAHNENTGETEHVESYTAKSRQLQEQGYYYAGHKQGVFTFCLQKSAPLNLPLAWQMRAEAE